MQSEIVIDRKNDRQVSSTISNSILGVDPVGFSIFLIIICIASAIGLLWNLTWIIPVGIVVAALVSSSIKIANQWEKAVVLRLGKYHKLAGPGLFIIIPVIDSVAAWVDQRIRTTSFIAEQTLTKDTVPVDVDAVLFWVVWDPEKAVLEVADYYHAVTWASQTALRDLIGETLLAEMLVGRRILDEELCKTIDERTEPWGIAVQSVEIRNVIIPSELQDAMSREAQAERDRRARILLGTAETEISLKFAGNKIYFSLTSLTSSAIGDSAVLFVSLSELAIPFSESAILLGITTNPFVSLSPS
jgi:uncharacterized membrane protein YqiK